jgi:hypothetical protein
MYDDIDNFEEVNDLYDLEEKGLSQHIRVLLTPTEAGVVFELPPIEVLSVEDLKTRLETAFPEYEFSLSIK